MAPAKLSVQDEKGHQWLVLPGDPASVIVALLKTLGFDRQVIPLALLRGREILTNFHEETWRAASEQATPQVSARLTAIIAALEEYVWQSK